MKEKGQGMVEVALTLVLVAVIVIAVVLVLTPLTTIQTVTGTVVGKFTTCPTNSIEIKTLESGAQTVSCNDGPQNSIVADFDGILSEFQVTDSAMSNLEVGQKYLFTFDQNGSIQKFTHLK